MRRIQLIHWKEAEGRARARELRAAGFQVDYEVDGPAALRVLREDPPAAVVIDLTRLPSHGREMAWALRQSKKTRAVPLVFVGGEREKIARLRKELPDATYCEWDTAAAAVERASAHPVRDPVVPASAQFYSKKPLAGKLGIKPGARVTLVDAPQGFEKTLGALPEGASLQSGLRGKPDLVLCFVTSRKAYTRALPKLVKAAEAGSSIWIGWPKKTSRIETDLDQDFVRTTPHAHGLVDFKICAIDDDWSGMCFARRRAKR